MDEIKNVGKKTRVLDEVARSGLPKEYFPEAKEYLEEIIDGASDTLDWIEERGGNSDRVRETLGKVVGEA